MRICNGRCGYTPCRCGLMNRRKMCKVCGQSKWLRDMEPIGEKGAPAYKRRSYCKTCKKKKNDAGTMRRKLDRIRASDKKRGFLGTMTVPELRVFLTSVCIYCGSSHKMTADRKDNSLGHTQDNCVPACFRCNSMRSDIPYEAWLVISEGVRRARDLGLLSDCARTGIGAGLACRDTAVNGKSTSFT